MPLYTLHGDGITTWTSSNSIGVGTTWAGATATFILTTTAGLISPDPHETHPPLTPGCVRCEREERGRVRNAEYVAATQRARELLMSLISPENRQRYKEHNRIQILGSDGGSWLVECQSCVGNVVQLGPPQRRWCAHPRTELGGNCYLPVLDAVIAQMLLLETDVPRFLEIANLY